MPGRLRTPAKRCREKSANSPMDSATSATPRHLAPLTGNLHHVENRRRPSLQLLRPAGERRIEAAAIKAKDRHGNVSASTADRQRLMAMRGRTADAASSTMNATSACISGRRIDSMDMRASSKCEGDLVTEAAGAATILAICATHAAGPATRLGLIRDSIRNRSSDDFVIPIWETVATPNRTTASRSSFALAPWNVTAQADVSRLGRAVVTAPWFVAGGEDAYALQHTGCLG